MSDDKKDEWAITKETTIGELVRVFSRFTTEQIEIHKNLNVEQFQDLFKRIKPRINGRKKVYLIRNSFTVTILEEKEHKSVMEKPEK